MQQAKQELSPLNYKHLNEYSRVRKLSRHMNMAQFQEAAFFCRDISARQLLLEKGKICKLKI